MEERGWAGGGLPVKPVPPTRHEIHIVDGPDGIIIKVIRPGQFIKSEHTPQTLPDRDRLLLRRVLTIANG